MYLPENDEQMHDIMSELRVYAAANDMPRLAEMLDDALVLLEEDDGRDAVVVLPGRIEQ